MGVLKEIFLTVFNMSVTAGVAVLLVIGVRFLIRKAPKSMAYLLWAVVGFRLICPYSLPSSMSIFNLELFQKHAVTDEKVAWNFVGTEHSAAEKQSGKLSVDSEKSGGIPAAESGTAAEPEPSEPVRAGRQISEDNRLDGMDIWEILSIVWLAGVIGLGMYELAAYNRLKRQVVQAVKSGGNVYECDTIDVPFVIGMFRPRIYLPFRVAEKERGYILLHEQYHIKRKDYLVKAGALALLILHWFNPLVWIAYHLMSEDMEMSCDEKVIKKLGQTMKCSYSNSLLSFAEPRQRMRGSHLAFGESSVKTRIKNVLGLKKPGKAAVCAAVAVCIFAAVLISVNPRQKNILRYDGRDLADPDAGFEVSYSVDSKINSYLLYREVYEAGELRDYKIVSSGGFQDSGGEIERRGTIQVGRSFKNEDTGMKGQLQWSVNGKEEVDRFDFGQYGFWSVADTYLVGGEVEKKEFKPEEDFVVAAWHLGRTGDTTQAFPCSDFDQRTRSKVVWNANPGEALYRLVVSEMDVWKLREKYEAAPYIREIYASKNSYVGDASADGKLLELLNVGSLGEYTMELQTSEEPYVLTVNFKEEPRDQTVLNWKMKQKAPMLLALIENVGEIHWTYPVAGGDGKETKYRWRMDCAEAEQKLGIDGLKKYTKTLDSLETLQDICARYRDQYEDIQISSDKYVAPDGRKYKYAKYLYGMLPNASFASSYHVLTNDEELTFDDVAWSMLSSTMEDKKDFYWIHERSASE